MIACFIWNVCVCGGGGVCEKDLLCPEYQVVQQCVKFEEKKAKREREKNDNLRPCEMQKFFLKTKTIKILLWFLIKFLF